MPMNPYEKYKQQSIMTMTQGDMLVKLYEETVTQLSGAIIFIERKEISKANDSLIKSQRILNYLKATLDFKYEISNNLQLLYDFFIQKIIEANVTKKAEPIEEVIPMIQELKETFSQADRLARIG
ncbi:flagellar export chaperone FliS [Oscillospiraceae bacterium PP1C4]